MTRATNEKFAAVEPIWDDLLSLEQALDALADHDKRKRAWSSWAQPDGRLRVPLAAKRPRQLDVAKLRLHAWKVFEGLKQPAVRSPRQDAQYDIELPGG